eukprot:6481890-Amphidinium_carterae.5
MSPSSMGARMLRATMRAARRYQIDICLSPNLCPRSNRKQFRRVTQAAGRITEQMSQTRIN